jgi:membrane protein implicated in regulation of membrane protease activity
MNSYQTIQGLLSPLLASQLLANQPAHITWLVAGLGCLVVGVLVTEPTLSALGIAAVITAIASLSISQFGIQLLIWGVLSVILAIVFRGFVPRESKDLLPSSEAVVFKAIPAGGQGEVSYEGSFWSARSTVPEVAIAAGQTVQVIGRQGNTLLVAPNFEDDLFRDLPQ